MRAREFIMKDAYSFDISDEALEESYKKMYNAYIQIFNRCNLDTIPIEADSGAIGGKVSHEFVVISELGGESEFVKCPNCGYASNIEAAKSMDDEAPSNENELEIQEVATGENKTIREVSQFLGVPENKLVKSLVYKADGKVYLVLLRGDDELNEIKLKNFLGAKSVEKATDEEIFSIFKAHVGSIGSVNVNINTIADNRIQKMKTLL